MGFGFSSLFSYFFPKEELQILMLGLYATGKTTILYKLKLGEVLNTIPTVGYNVETLEYKNLCFKIFDICPSNGIRDRWHPFFDNTSAIIFVLDASDLEYINFAADELKRTLQHNKLRDVVVLVLANKQDLPHALSTSDVEERLQLHSVKQEWHVHGVCATRGTGLYEGLEILRQMLNRRKKNENPCQ